MERESHAQPRARVIQPEQGRRYEMGRMTAVFYAYQEETDGRYAISEWWLEPRTPGPGVHQHPEDHIYYILSGTLTLFLDSEQTEAPRGSYVLIPGGARHDFENHGNESCGFISINAPAGFEAQMPGIVDWFAQKPLQALPEN